MIICDLGAAGTALHLEAEQVRVADGPGVRATGSLGGKGRGWETQSAIHGAHPPTYHGGGSTCHGGTHPEATRHQGTHLEASR